MRPPVGSAGPALSSRMEARGSALSLAGGLLFWIFIFVPPFVLQEDGSSSQQMDDLFDILIQSGGKARLPEPTPQPTSLLRRLRSALGARFIGFCSVTERVRGRWALSFGRSSSGDVRRPQGSDKNSARGAALRQGLLSPAAPAVGPVPAAWG